MKAATVACRLLFLNRDNAVISSLQCKLEFWKVAGCQICPFLARNSCRGKAEREGSLLWYRNQYSERTPFLGTVLRHVLPVDAAEHLHRDIGSHFYPWEWIRNAKLTSVKEEVDKDQHADPDPPILMAIVFVDKF